MAGAKRKVVPEEVILARKVAESVKEEAKDLGRGNTPAVREVEDRARRVEMLALRLAGFSDVQIADRMEVDFRLVNRIIDESLEKASNPAVTEMRTLENQRLDRAQSAIWTQVVAGDTRAVNTFLRISQQRSKINGLYAPTKIDMSVNIRNDMEQALNDLEKLMDETAEQIVDAEVVEDDETSPPDSPVKEIESAD